MIASVMATLDGSKLELESLVSLLSRRSEIEVGELQNNRLPMTFESPEATGLEQLTDWIADLPGVSQIDVIFVHLESEDRVQ